MEDKYNIGFSNTTIQHNKNRLTNQIWKLIPMYENHEDWKTHLEKIIVEIVGLYEIFNISSEYLTLLSNLEGLLYKKEIEFSVYRSKVFESINLLRDVLQDE